MSRVLKVGIIGTGWVAEMHAESYGKRLDVQVAAVADLSLEKAKAFCKRYGLDNAHCYEGHQAMLKHEQLDAVSVCTYNAAHAICTIDALEAGAHVLLEKPMCTSIEEAVAIMRAEKASGKEVCISFQPRMDPNMQYMNQIVQSGILGDVYYVQTGGGRRCGIPNSTFIQKDTAGHGALGDIGCYTLDRVLCALNYPRPLTVTGYTADFFGTNPMYQKADRFHTAQENAARFNVDDFAAALIRLENGTTLDFRISWAMHMDTFGDTLMLGTKGGLRIPHTEKPDRTLGAPMKLYTDVAGQPAVTELPLLPLSGDSLSDRIVDAFLDSIRNGGPSPVPTSQILYNQLIIDAAAHSARLGHEVEVVVPALD